MRNAVLDEAQAGIKIAGRNINNLRYADDTTLMAESEEELKSLLMKMKEESEKVGLKLNIQKTKIMASSPITSWQIDAETMGTVTDFIFLGSKVTADGDCSHEIKRRLFLGRKAMTNLDSILKSRDIILPTKVLLVKAMDFPVVMYGCESWTIKKVECWRTDAFELWCWWRLLRVPWIARRSNQSILKEINPEYSLEGLILKLKLQYLGHLMWLTHWKRPWCWERLRAGGEGDNRGWDDWIASPTWWAWVWASSGNWWWTGKPGMVRSLGVTKSQTRLSDWTELNWTDSIVRWTLFTIHGRNKRVNREPFDCQIGNVYWSWRVKGLTTLFFFLLSCLPSFPSSFLSSCLPHFFMVFAYFILFYCSTSFYYCIVLAWSYAHHFSF